VQHIAPKRCGNLAQGGSRRLGLAAERVKTHALFCCEIVGQLKISVVKRHILNVILAVADEISDVEAILRNPSHLQGNP